MEAGGEEVIPDGEVEAIEEVGLADEAGALENGIRVKAGEALAEPGDLGGIFDAAETAGIPVVEGLVSEQGGGVGAEGFAVGEKEVEGVGEAAAAAAGGGVVVGGNHDGGVRDGGVVPEVALGREDFRHGGGDVLGPERPIAMHGEQNGVTVDVEGAYVHAAAGEERVADLGPGAGEVLMGAAAEAGEQGLGWGEAGEVEGDFDGVGGGNGGGDEAIFAVEFEQGGTEDDAVFEGMPERAGPVLAKVVGDGDGTGAAALEEPARGVGGWGDGCFRGGGLEVGDGVEELGLTGPLRREEKEQLGAGPAGCGVQGQVQRHMDLGGIVEIKGVVQMARRRGGDGGEVGSEKQDTEQSFHERQDLQYRTSAGMRVIQPMRRNLTIGIGGRRAFDRSQ